MLVIALTLVVLAVILLLKYQYSYWERKGFPYASPQIPFGNLGAVVKRQQSLGDRLRTLYMESNEPLLGVYLLWRPALMIRDPDLAKDILTKNFAQFHDRGLYYDEPNDPMSANLFVLPGAKWKSLRNKLTPAFTSGKLKSMFSTVEEVGVTLQKHIDERIDYQAEYDLKNILTRYAVDIIQSVIFGLDANCIENPDSDFATISQQLTINTFTQRMRFVGTFLCPGLIKLLHMRSIPPNIANFMLSVVKKTIEFREKSDHVRKDLMQLLIQLRNTGEMKEDGDWNVKPAANQVKTMSIEQCAAQAFLFHVAGSETSSSAAAFCLFEVCRNKEVLQKLEQDIADTLKKHNNTISYESIQDMKYLDSCILETIRKYPGLPFLNRECTETFHVPGTNYIIEKGTPIIIPTLGLHRDERYFPNAQKFDPERHLGDIKNFKESAFHPFGEGPRICIGLRLGKMNAKMAVVMLLTKFDIEPLEDKEIEFSFDSAPLLPKNGIPVSIKRKPKPLI